MPDRTAADQLQPCLLDRLTDNEPDKKTEGRDRKVMSMRQYRAAVLRDIRDILNARARPAGDAIYDYPHAAQSVLNIGMRDPSGTTASMAGADAIVGRVREVLTRYEPRLLPGSMSVRIATSAGGTNRSLLIEIDAQLWAQPAMDHMFIKTEVDLETGFCDFRGGNE